MLPTAGQCPAYLSMAAAALVSAQQVGGSGLPRELGCKNAGQVPIVLHEWPHELWLHFKVIS